MSAGPQILQKDPLDQAVHNLLLEAERQGVVVTISLVPMQPLAMGNYAHRIEVRPRNPRFFETFIDERLPEGEAHFYQAGKLVGIITP